MIPLISIIVPVYNVEDYLRECLNSLISQTYKNIEVILIDDCSTDKSYEICLEYAKKYNKVTAFKNEKNMSQAASRNRGLKKAKGKYILFVDSDDYIDPTLCEQAINQLNKHPEVDTVQWGYDYFQDGSNKLIYKGRPILENKECIFQPEIKRDFVSTLTVSYNDLYDWFDQGGKYYDVVFSKKRGGFVWTYLLSKEVIDKNELEFPLIKYAEDIIFITKYLLCCKGIVNIDKELSFYRNRKTSTMHEKRPVKAKIRALEAKEDILTCVPESEWEMMREKWQGQTCIIAMNGARIESLKDYLKLMKATPVRIAVKKFEIKRSNWKFGAVMTLLKLHLYIPYWCMIRLAMKMGKFKNNTDIC